MSSKNLNHRVFNRAKWWSTFMQDMAMKDEQDDEIIEIDRIEEYIDGKFKVKEEEDYKKEEDMAEEVDEDDEDIKNVSNLYRTMIPQNLKPSNAEGILKQIDRNAHITGIMDEEVREILEQTLPLVERHRRCLMESGLEDILNTFDLNQIEAKVGGWLRKNNSQTVSDVINPSSKLYTFTTVKMDTDSDSDSIDTARYIRSCGTNKKPHSSKTTIKSYRLVERRRNEIRKKYALLAPDDTMQLLRNSHLKYDNPPYWVRKDLKLHHHHHPCMDKNRITKRYHHRLHNNTYSPSSASDEDGLTGHCLALVPSRRNQLQHYRCDDHEMVSPNLCCSQTCYQHDKCSAKKMNIICGCCDCDKIHSYEEELTRCNNKHLRNNIRHVANLSDEEWLIKNCKFPMKLQCKPKRILCIEQSEIPKQQKFEIQKTVIKTHTINDDYPTTSQNIWKKELPKNDFEIPKVINFENENLNPFSVKNLLKEVGIDEESSKKSAVDVAKLFIGPAKNRKKPKIDEKEKNSKTDKPSVVPKGKKSKNKAASKKNTKDKMWNVDNKDNNIDNDDQLNSSSESLFQKQLQKAIKESEQQYKIEQQIAAESKKLEELTIKDIASEDQKKINQKTTKSQKQMKSSYSTLQSSSDSDFEKQEKNPVKEKQSKISDNNKGTNISPFKIKKNIKENQTPKLNKKSHKKKLHNPDVISDPLNLKQTNSISKDININNRKSTTDDQNNVAENTFFANIGKICNSTALGNNSGIAGTPLFKNIRKSSENINHENSPKTPRNKLPLGMKKNVPSTSSAAAANKENMKGNLQRNLTTIIENEQQSYNESSSNKSKIENKSSQEVLLYAPDKKTFIPSESIINNRFHITEEYLTSVIGNEKASKFFKYYVGPRSFNLSSAVYYRPPKQSEDVSDSDSDDDILELCSRYGELYESKNVTKL